MTIINALRRLLFYPFFIPWTIFWALMMTALGWHPKRMVIGQYFGGWWSKVNLAFLGVKVDADFSVLDPSERYVFVVNHSSNMDITVLYALLMPYRILFVAKKSLYSIPIFGWALKYAGHISIDRSNRRAGMKSLEEAVDKAHQGHSPIIFPEGTRNTDPDNLLPFKTGAMILALKCNHKVAPLVIWGTQELLPAKAALPRPGTRVKIRALPLVDMSGYDMKNREALKDDLYAAMNAARKELAHGQ